ncbi:MAG TPA: AMP-binding protein [Bryobacteraceae bacterium]|nr:AMP-binding protein [Bryobacteraceae bacterium]
MMRISDEDLPLQCAYRWERKRAGHIFLTQPFDGGKIRDWTWSQAMDEVRRMAAHLKAQNWEPGSRIAILSRNCAWWIMADLAIWMAGYVSVPIYPSLKAHTVRQILEHSEAKACFVGAADEDESPSHGIPSTVLQIGFPTAPDGEYTDWDALIKTCEPMMDSPTYPAKQLATIIYTSGTTGTPKGVMHHFEALAFDAKVCAEVFRMTTRQRILSYLPLAHVVERIGVEVITLFLGSRIFFTEGLPTFLIDLQRARPTLFLSVPRLLLKFQQGVYTKIPKEKLDSLMSFPVVKTIVKRRILRQLGLSSVRIAACGAAPLPVDILLWYRNLGLDLAEGYGMTETWVTHLPAPGSVRPGYVGAPLPGVEQKLVENGELLIRSPMNMLGYYKDPQGTQNAFTSDGFFRTGDLASIDSDGQLKLVGRVKEQFKTSKGKYVAPAPIEGRLVTHPAIEAGCLMGAGLPSPFAVILLSEKARADCIDPSARQRLEESLKEQMERLNEQLDPHERVKFLAIADGPWTVGNGMVTPTLKIKRTILEARYQAFIDDWRNRDSAIVWETEPGAPLGGSVAMESQAQPRE